MVAAYIIGTVAEVLLLGPSVLAVFGSNSTNTWAYVAIGVVMGLIMLTIPSACARALGWPMPRMQLSQSCPEKALRAPKWPLLDRSCGS